MGSCRRLAPVLLALGALVPAFATPLPPPVSAPAPPPLCEYVLAEKEKGLGPAGERIRSLGGSVLVQGGRARWRLTASRFPRSTASEAILDGSGRLLLVDPAARSVALGAEADFPDLFRAPPAADSPASPTWNDVEVRASQAGEGRPFQGEPTSRTTLRGSWRLSLVLPGRVAGVRTTVEAVIDTLEGEGAGRDARSPLDDLLRLFPARGDPAEAIARELGAVKGFPVRVTVVAVSEEMGEPLAGPAAGADPAQGRALRIRTETTREVTKLSRRAGRAEDAALFAPPEEFRSRPLERLLPSPEGPR